MKHCSKCNKEYPDSAKFCRTCGHELATKQQLSADFQAKDSVYKIKLKDNPGDAALLYEYSHFLIENEAYDLAISKLAEFLEAFPKDIQARKLLASIFMASKKMDSYIAQLLIIQEISEKADPCLFLDLAKAYFDTGNLEKARALLEMLSKTTTQNLEAIRLEADIALRHGDNAAYESALQDILRLDPNNGAAEELFDHLYRAGNYSLAAELAKNNYKALSDNPIAFFILARQLIYQGFTDGSNNYQNAEKWLEKALEHKPPLPVHIIREARILKSFLLVSRDKTLDLLPNIEFLQTNIQDTFLKSICSHIYDALSRYYKENGNITLAIDCCRQAVDIEPTERRYSILGTLYYLNAKHLDEIGDISNALRRYKEFWHFAKQHPCVEEPYRSSAEKRIFKIEDARGKRFWTIFITTAIVLSLCAFIAYLSWGVIEVQVNQSADISLLSADGKYSYQIADNKQLTTKYHFWRSSFDLKINKIGYNSHEASLETPWGRKIKVYNVELEPNVATMNLFSEPPGAKITIKNLYEEKSCISPCSLTNIFALDTDITAELDGYNEYKTSISIKTGENIKLNIIFKGDLDINSYPEGASIFIDGTLHGKTPLVVQSVPAKHINIIVKHDPYFVMQKHSFPIIPMIVNKMPFVKLVAIAEEKYEVYRLGNNIWQIDPPPQSMYYSEAVAYCNSLKIGPWKWRIPSVNELIYLGEKSKAYYRDMVEVCLLPGGLKGGCGKFWSSTAYSNDACQMQTIYVDVLGWRRSGGFLPCKFTKDELERAKNVSFERDYIDGQTKRGVRCVSDDNSLKL